MEEWESCFASVLTCSQLIVIVCLAGSEASRPSSSPSSGNVPITYVVEVATSNRSACRKCDQKIAKDEVSSIHVYLKFGGADHPLRLITRVFHSQIRIGVVMNSGRFGITTRWQHVPCTVFSNVNDVMEIEGYEYLDGKGQGSGLTIVGRMY